MSLVSRTGILETVVHDGSGTEPYRGLLRVHERLLLQVVSRTPIRAEIGDVIHLTGVLTPSGDAKIPDEIIVPEPEPAHNRFQDIARSAEIVSHGPSLGAGRPGVVATLDAAKRLLASRQEAPHGAVTVTRAGDRLEDPAAQAAVDAVRASGAAEFVAVLDPHAFTPRGLPDAQQAAFRNHRLAMADQERRAQETTAAIRAAAPGNIALDNHMTLLGKTLANGVGLATPERDKSGLRFGFAKRVVVAPYSRFETGTAFFINTTSLPPSFAPKRVLPVETRRMFSALHEAGHAIEAAYGVSDLDDATRDAHLGECFADAHAVVALAVFGTHPEALRDIARMRHIGAVVIGSSHATGFAVEAAIDAGLALKSKGGPPSWRAIALAARGAAFANRLGPEERAALDEFRGRSLVEDNISYDVFLDYLKRETANGTAPPEITRRWERAAEAADSLVIRARDAAKVPGVIAAWKGDMEDTIAAAGGTAADRANVLATERRLLVVAGGTLEAGSYASDLAAERALILAQEAGRAGPTRPAETPATRPAIALVRPKLREPAMSGVFAHPPERRVRMYLSELAAEHLCYARAGGAGRADSLAAAAAHRNRRGEIAFSLRADSAAWSWCRDHDSRLARDVEREALAQPGRHASDPVAARFAAARQYRALTGQDPPGAAPLAETAGMER